MSNNPSQVIKLFGKTIIQQVDNTQSNSTQTTSSSSSTSTSLEADQETSTGMEKAEGGGGGSSKTAVVSCPRCKSKETKFCYFNNYNVNQPRHFCKSCRRYWTAGGTLRTVPVGAGRRKNRAPHPDGELGSTCLGLDQDIH